MNILVPDIWLRKFLQTKATAEELKKYLSLCGPSIERIYGTGDDTVYDVEITTNRPDSMSIFGIAREASVILPQFGIKASLTNNPYTLMPKAILQTFAPKKISKKVTITTDETINPRFTAIVIDDINIAPSPLWLKTYLELSGIRSINTVVDVTNYLMRAYGQPAHAFDYDKISKGKNGYPVMHLRASKKGEKITTLDGKTHILPGDDIVMEDGDGKLFDLCGIMGGASSHITDDTKTVILFLQTYDPAHIRHTSMALAHRTEAAALFEKGPDSEMVLPALSIGTKLLLDIADGVIVSTLYDIYPKPFSPYSVSVTKEKILKYLGEPIEDTTIHSILEALGFHTTITDANITATIPSYRRDVTIDVDIIEEIARIKGYHTLGMKLPDGEPPMIMPDKTLIHEVEMKKRLRDFGLTEIFTYSMISERELEVAGSDTEHVYQLSNPLSSDWVYMRPSLIPSMLNVIKQNLSVTDSLSLFELSNIYKFRQDDLPDEKAVLCIACTGNQFRELKGLVETVFDILGIHPKIDLNPVVPDFMNKKRSYVFGQYGYIGYVSDQILSGMGITKPVIIANLDFDAMAKNARPIRTYVPIPKYPSAYEDYALIVTPNTRIGLLLDYVQKLNPLITSVTLLDSHQNTQTIRVTFTNKEKNLTVEDIQPIRNHIVYSLEKEFGASLKKK